MQKTFYERACICFINIILFHFWKPVCRPILMQNETHVCFSQVIVVGHQILGGQWHTNLYNLAIGRLKYCMKEMSD